MKRISLAIVCLAVLSACGGRAAIYEEPPSREGAQQRGPTLPDPIPATPVYLATVDKPISNQQFERFSETPGVAVMAPISVRALPVEGPRGTEKLRVAGVEPLAFRSVAPASTRDADFVWLSLIVGQAVPTFDAAAALGLEGSGEITIGGTPGFQVSAFADNGVPNIADVMVQNGAERQLDLGDPRIFLIGAASGITIEALGKDLEKALPGMKLKRLLPDLNAPAQPSAPAAPRPVGQVSGGVVGSMTFQVLKGGFIRPDPSWVAANIVSGSVPILGTVNCHKLLIPRLAGALGQLEEADLAHLVKPSQYGGCYVPRFIDRDSTKPLSSHAFGLAVDFNVPTNQLGTRGDMDPRVVEVMARWGFSWGGYWSRPDPMHFELVG
jgi:hypothetical protein